ncbi:MAG: hypothetical protein IKN96_04970 [Oscillibacter sp.]|nr:hypothetical protein [Oscillibacter sp.]
MRTAPGVGDKTPSPAWAGEGLRVARRISAIYTPPHLDRSVTGADCLRY